MKNILFLLLTTSLFFAAASRLGAQSAGKTVSYQLNERIEVNTLGSWDKATIIAIGKGEHEGEFKVHYDGWASSYDRWLRPIYFRKVTAASTPASASTPAAKAALYQLNERIEVNTLGSWDKATIIEVGRGAHENEFKVHYDGYASSYDRWLLPVYFRKVAGAAAAPAATPPTAPTAPVAPAGVGSAAAGEKAEAPRLGKYNINSYGAVGKPPLYLGHIELLKGGKYRISRKSSGGYYGEGKYSFDAGANTVQWLSGPCKDNAWGGAFTVEGKTHKIRLRSGTIATSTTE